VAGEVDKVHIETKYLKHDQLTQIQKTRDEERKRWHIGDDIATRLRVRLTKSVFKIYVKT